MTLCSDIRDLLPAYLDGEIDDRRRARVDSHLKSCASCREEAVALRRDDRVLRATLGARVAASPRIDAAVWARLDREASGRRNRPRFAVPRLRLARPAIRWTPAFAGVAALLLIAAAASLLRGPRMGPLDVQVASIAGDVVWAPPAASVWRPLKVGAILHLGDRVRTGAAGRVTERWRDESEAILGPDGAAAILGSGQGLELVQGKLWARVRKRDAPLGPFTIRAEQATAEVMGTEFDLEVPPDRRTTTLVVFHGAVRLFNARGSVLVREWMASRSTDGAAPSAPQPTSPLSSSMWWLRRG